MANTMDSKLFHSQTCEIQSSSELLDGSSTPKESYCTLPLTPPTSEKHNHPLPTLSSVQQVVENIQRSQHFSTEHSLLQQYSLPLGEFQELLETLKNAPGLKRCTQDKVRYDYDPQESRLTIRMPSPVHDFFATLLAQEITNFLTRVSVRRDAAGQFAANIFNGGSSRIVLQNDPPSSDELSNRALKSQRQPDAQFQHRDAAYPGVVLEISYSQNGNELDKLAWDYILNSNGDIKAVIGIDIGYGNVHPSTVSLWRAVTSSDAAGDSILDVQRVVANQPFRAPDNSKINQQETLKLNLSDFATDELAENYEPINCSISYDKMAELLDCAEHMQQVREAEKGGRGVKSAQKVKKRKRPSTPDDRIKSDDEELFREQEVASAERVMVSDEEFNVPSRKRRI